MSNANDSVSAQEMLDTMFPSESTTTAPGVESHSLMSSLDKILIMSRKDPQEAAAEFFQSLVPQNKALALGILSCAELSDEAINSGKHDLLMQGSWGKMWLTPARLKDLRHLGQAFAEFLCNEHDAGIDFFVEEKPKRKTGHAVTDMANDFGDASS